MIFATCSFLGYLWYQWIISSADEVKKDRIDQIALDRWVVVVVVVVVMVARG